MFRNKIKTKKETYEEKAKRNIYKYKNNRFRF